MFLSVCVFDDKLAKVTHRRSVCVPPTSGQTSARVFLSADDANLLSSDRREPSASQRGNGAKNGSSSRLRISLAAADTPPEVSSRWWRGTSPAAHLRPMNFIIFSRGGAIAPTVCRGYSWQPPTRAGMFIFHALLEVDVSRRSQEIL